MSNAVIIITILVLAMLVVLPTWRYSARWGYMPSGALGSVLLALVVMMAAGRL